MNFNELRQFGLEMLSMHPVFEQCSRASIARMLSLCELHQFHDGQDIYQASCQADALWFMCNGSVHCQSNRHPEMTIDQGFVGTEVALSHRYYLYNVTAIGPTAMLRIPLNALPDPVLLMDDNRAMSILHAVTQTRKSPRGPDEEEDNCTHRKLLKVLGWICVAVLPFLIFTYGEASGYFSEDYGERWRQIRLATVITAGMMLWLFNLIAPYIAGLLMLFLILSLGIVPSTVTLSGFSSSAFFMTLSLFGFSAVILGSGLISRLTLHVSMVFCRHTLMRHFVALLAIFGLSAILPGKSSRAQEWAKLQPSLFPTNPRRKFRFSLIGFIIFVHVTLFSPLFLTGSAANLALYGVIPDQYQAGLGWQHWLKYSAVAIGVLLSGSMLFIWFHRRTLHESAETKSQFHHQLQNQKRVIESFSPMEWFISLILLVYFSAQLSTSDLKIDHRLVAIIVLAIFLLGDMLKRQQINHFIDWKFLMLTGSIVGIVNCTFHVGLADVYAKVFPLASYIIRHEPVYFIISLAIVAGVFVPLINRGSVFVGALAMPLAVINGFNPWIVIFVILMTDHCWINPKYSLTLKQIADWLPQPVSNHHRLKRWQLFFIALRFIAVLSSISYWQMLGMI